MPKFKLARWPQVVIDPLREDLWREIEAETARQAASELARVEWDEQNYPTHLQLLAAVYLIETPDGDKFLAQTHVMATLTVEVEIARCVGDDLGKGG